MVKVKFLVCCSLLALLVACSHQQFKPTVAPVPIHINDQTVSIESLEAPPIGTPPDFIPKQVNHFTLKNGLTVLHFQSPKKISATAITGIFLHNPDPFKPIKLNLIANWNRINLYGENQRISSLAADMGAKIRSLAGSIATGWYLETLQVDQPKALKLLAAIVQKRQYTKLELKHQKQNYNLAQQLGSVSGISQSLQLYQSLVFSQNSGIAKQAKKTSRKNTLAKIKLSELKNYFDTNFIAPSMVLIMITPSPIEQLKPIIENLFSSLAETPKAQINKPDSQATPESQPLRLNKPKPGIFAINRPNSVQVDIRISFTPLTLEKLEYQSLKFFADTLAGRSLNSRMQSDLRERMGLSYSISHRLDQVSDFHSLHFISSTENNKLPALITAMQQHIDYLIEHGLSRKEFEFIKQRRLINLQRVRLHPFQKISFMLQNFTNQSSLQHISYEAQELIQLNYEQFHLFLKRLKKQQRIVILSGDTATIRHHLCTSKPCEIHWYSNKLRARTRPRFPL